jgi:cobalt-zinc-cadmium efflux system outer membrane protein
LLWSGGACLARDSPDQWTESQLIERFLAQSPQALEHRARVALAEANMRTRLVYPNPSVAYSREGAGYNAFFEVSQVLPLSGRMRYLRGASAAEVSAAEASRDASLWSLRSDLRLAFYRMLASQERVALLSTATTEVEQLIGILRKREAEGEGSRYDRLRAEREAAELRIDVTAARALVAAEGARVAAFLPDGSSVRQARGDLGTPMEPPALDVLLQRALAARADYRAAQANIARYRIEEQAARRLRVPEPLVAAGLKRADVTSGLPPNPFSNVVSSGLTFGVSVPLPIFNNGRYEVSRYQAEREQASARLGALAREIRMQIEGARELLAIRKDALADWLRELQPGRNELTRIAQVAYQEGEIGILEVLDSLRISRAANLRLLDLQAGVKEAFIELERAVGEEVHP